MKRVIGVLAAALVFAMVKDAQLMLTASIACMNFFQDVMFPSLLPFAICTTIIIETGIVKGGSWSAFFMKKLFRINGNGLVAVVLGVLSGFPAGAAMVAGLYKKGALSKNESERLLAFVNNAGPSFVISAIGIGCYNSIKMGYILFFSQLLAAFSVGVVLSCFGSYHKNPSEIKPSGKSASAIFVESVTNSVSICFNILGFILIFGIATAFMEKYLGVNNPVIFSLIEVSNAAKCTDPFAASAVLGFGGICVFCQTLYHIKDTGLGIKFFLWGKLMFGIFAYLYSKILLTLMPISVVTSHVAGDSGRTVSILALWLFSVSVACIILALFLNADWIKNDKKSPYYKRKYD